ncbi:MAG: family transporter [Rhodospirillales bacterium]|nr:family transporter [Rhodospirillales bacterium]
MADETLASELLEAGEAVPTDGTPDDVTVVDPVKYQSIVLTAILILLVFYTLYFTREVVTPIFFAVLLKLLLRPAMRFLGKVHIPEPVAGFLMILVLFASFVGLFSSLAGPATEWFGKLPQTLPRIEQRLSVLKEPLARFHDATKELSKVTDTATPEGGSPPVVVQQGPAIGGILLTSTQALLTGLLETLIVLFFLLIAGDVFLRKMVEVLPRLRDKKRAVAISQEVEKNISAYLVTISGMNLLVGIAVGTAAYLFGLGDGLLWGVVAFLLNYVPILGPMSGIVLFFLAGLLAFDNLLTAGLLAGTYLGIHLIEGEVVTPMLLARRFTLNPVLVIISLIFWYWMWGVPGAIISVPILATTKIICDHIRPLAPVGHFIGG